MQKYNSTNVSSTSSGFTLIELIITVAILGILAAVAIPEYNAQKRKSNRADAIKLLMTAVVLQERHRTNEGGYAVNIASLTSATSAKYDLALSASSTTSTFTLRATAKGDQLYDLDCRTFDITHTGVNTAKNVSGGNSPNCWPR